MLLIKLAWRNVWRNRRRSLITVSAVTFGLAVLIFLWGFGDGAHERMVDNYIKIRVGHVQLHARGFLADEDYSKTLRSWEDGIKSIINMPGVVGASPRILEQGMLASADQSSGVFITGLLPQYEAMVSNFTNFIKAGRFVPGESTRDIVIGADLARLLKVSVGDRVVLLMQGYYGAMASDAFNVCGIFKSGIPEMDRGYVFMNLHALAETLQMPNVVHEISVRFKERKIADTFTLKNNNVFRGEDVEISSWDKLSPLIVQWVELDNMILYIIMFVVVVIVTIGITNSMLMTIYERFREFGIQRALGTNRGELVFMVLVEAAFLCLIGVVAGGTLGLGLNFYFGWHGIDLAGYATAFAPFYSDTVIYPNVSVTHVIQSALIVMFAGITSALYPAFHAARIHPSEALRHV